MAFRGNNNIFLTPDRKPIPDSAIKGFSTTADRGILKNLGSEYSPQFIPSETNRRVNETQGSTNDKLSWLQSRVGALKAYVNECPKIEKRKIREIFNWSEKGGPDNSQEKKLLKQLGSKVRGLIKQNHRLKHTIYSGQITELRSENERLRSLLDNLHQGESVRNRIMLQENEMMKNYIQNAQNTRYDSHEEKPFENTLGQKMKEEGREVIEEVEEPKQENEPLFNETLLSLDRLKNLKKYFTLYVNTVIEQNDEKFESQRKYIDVLEKRVSQLQKINEKLDHFKFQKKVKLQESERKSKNYTAGAPKVLGDTLENDLLQQQVEQKQQEQKKKPQLVMPVNYYAHKQRTTQSRGQYAELEEEIERLRAQNTFLKENYEYLKDKYEVEIQKHIRDISEREKLISQVQRLRLQNKVFKGELEYQSLG